MWGSPERAICLEDSDHLAVLLFQISGPSHIPWKDQRWQELLYGYDVWVHVEQRKGGLLERAGQALAQHAPRSSNLAALALHVTRMVDAILPKAEKAFSDRIAMVGRARATAGTLNLFRILTHAVIANQPSVHSHDYLSHCFSYRNRDNNHEYNTAPDLLSALLRFLTQCSATMKEIPEIYDTTALVLDWLLVAFSTQLYRPMVSSFQRKNGGGDLFWTLLMQQAHLHATLPKNDASWTPRELICCLMQFQLDRLAAPARSIQEHNSSLAKQVAATKGEKCGPDGLYETHLIVTASSKSTSKVIDSASSTNTSRALARYQSRSSANMFIDATKGALVLSSTIILLPFRLVTLALGLLRRGDKGYDQLHKTQLQSSFSRSRRTNDVLWLTEAPVADLAGSFLLLILNNERAGSNAFRNELASLSDNRWEGETDLNGGLPDLPNLGDEMAPLVKDGTSLSSRLTHDENAFSMDFERIFTSFGTTVHNEVGALLLYTILQASPKFSEAIAVRSDLDTIVLPLLRTLYFSSSTRFYTASTSSKGKDGEAAKKLNIRNCPFRSQSQLYVMIILLLIFSQDTSFGADAFRRISIQSIPWYKERNLKTISLGSMIVLSMLRSLTFNLNRLHDPFLLSNCCAVLLNLAPSVVELHDYAAMRLSAVAVACIKRYAELVVENPNDDEEDLSSPRAMHGEVARTLLQVIRHCVGSKNIDRNLHLIYALVYHQTDFKKVFTSNGCPFRKSEYSSIQKVIDAAKRIIDEGDDARTAAKALKVLLDHTETLKQVATDSKRRSSTEDLFTYEEESDPEVFFVPYVWEIIVSVVTSSSIEWDTDKIKVFALLDDLPEDIPEGHMDEPQHDTTKFSTDVSEVV
ncbi:hypothetical protein FisN_5Lh500 [Fistulifera solaris]|uniref:Dymeclin n=1 Tax=Fistulifera solaris TaxID=1519565 RepID=A0A1Z5KGG4_FISSO|nr:hypothetical protein FisN_5Lh500 [Fistulifera solaris]|eukprot:GAX25400.1 hypothetical protein FisN_5Lh500 [Fistulifera solaris]